MTYYEGNNSFSMKVLKRWPQTPASTRCFAPVPSGTTGFEFSELIYEWALENDIYVDVRFVSVENTIPTVACVQVQHDKVTHFRLKWGVADAKTVGHI